MVGPSQLRMSSVADCMCFRGLERTEDGCRNCSQYMIQPFFSNNVCSNCPAGQFFEDRHVQCQLCDVAQDDVGLVLNPRDASLQWADDERDCVCRAVFERMMHGLCKACSAGKFRGGNDARHCELCLYDTFQDSVTQLACIQCPAYSSTLWHVGRKSVSECVRCAGYQPMSQAGLCAPCAAGTVRSNRHESRERVRGRVFTMSCTQLLSCRVHTPFVVSSRRSGSTSIPFSSALSMPVWLREICLSAKLHSEPSRLLFVL